MNGFGGFILFFFALVALTGGWAGCLYSYSRGRLRRPANAVAVLLLLTGVLIWVAATDKERRERAWERRLNQLESVAATAQPAIKAIRAYEAQRGSPPTSLAAIATTLPPPSAEVAMKPTWGFGAPGTIRTFPTAPSDNWALGIDVRSDFCPRCGVSFGDTFVYHSDGNYPKYLYGGVLERVGDWGYYHE